ncbi:UDP-N-acetylglucosamine transferase subunit alg13 [Cytospora mali]|uniref:UDP-N-acetylglucosamine transferase subunit ALG13 n=1 Tax=Cytospora mali TaxID=578113 RepID=A0A194V5E5_CYTMA|nr:UDP-N-acetylglucosamine transferase subunit alg13 [Valsa mali var. pyri (nom. inval.)]
MGQLMGRLIGTNKVIRQPTDNTNVHLNDRDMKRHVLITGGATVAFVELLLEVSTPQFLSALQAHGITHIDIQCATYVDEIEKRFQEMDPDDEYDLSGLSVRIFDFEVSLKKRMQQLCRGEEGVQLAGFVIGHAGTGTIADAFESDVALVVVANPNLMDDHQTPFAAVITKEHKTLVQGHLGRLIETIPKALDLIEQNGLDHLEPMVEETLPLGEGQGMHFVDQVIVHSL